MIDFTNVIKERVKMQDIFQQYGFKVKNGAVKCPFHNEKTASLRTYNNGERWKCFGCGEGGSVIDFVMKYFNINFTQAITRINNDFSLCLAIKSLTHKERLENARQARTAQIERSERMKAEQEKEERNTRMNALFRSAFIAKKVLAPKKIGDPLTEEYAFACRIVEYLEYMFEEEARG